MVPSEPPEQAPPTEDLSRPSRRTSVGRYEIRGELGSGAMGTVWRAHDTRLDREVAVKEVHLPFDMPPRERERARTRMIREAQAAARVSHPSVVTVHDVLEVDGVPFIVMELLEGESLRDRLLRTGPLSEAEVERISRPLLDALWAAHKAGVVHRDVKPANIVLTAGARPVLTDFGIANLPDHGGTALTGTGAILGTAAYAAPERLEHDDNGAVSDLWSLGATLFAALTGESPFKRDTLTATITAVLTRPVPPVPAQGRLATVIGGLLDREPRRRLLPERALALLEGPAPEQRVDGPSSPSGARHSGAHFSGPQTSAAQHSGPQHSGAHLSGPQAPAARHSGPRHPFGAPPTSAAHAIAPTTVTTPPRRSRLPVIAGGVAALAVVMVGALTLWFVLPDAGEREVATDAGDSSGEAAGASSPEPSEPPATESAIEGSDEEAPEGFTRYDDGVVTLDLPEEWELVPEEDDDTGSGSTRLASYTAETGVETGTVQVYVTRFDILVYDAEDAMHRMNELLTEDEDFSDLEQLMLEPRLEGPGLQSAIYEATFRHEEREVPDRWMFTREFSDENSGTSYRLSFNFPADARDGSRDDFETVLESFAPSPE
ncbi:serine/threonine-protein kinase [Nocardiopsis sp. MG754419]|uniref:serine/threonine-protein kinase n=1 Tax=Nocardiopsis sp. MG754419 TaxID=2259865 RepID=UPI001BAAA0D0|nr:serine/threonine-protein kinase [Nocardiopsis sp. MG754419]MBR8743399.1 hypothetical protein [Nocardiopsis sp. MG754419]